MSQIHSTIDEHYAGATFRYAIDAARLPRALAERFVPLGFDEETRAFVDSAVAHRHGRALSVAHAVLGAFLSDFDVNGLLGTYPLFLMSSAQWLTLLGPARVPGLLDVGAGNGDVTARFAPLAARVETTETSRMMARRLTRRGYSCRRVDVAEVEPEGEYDLVTCLNVIDRSARPKSVLANLGKALGPEGRLIVATPLPYEPFVYAGGTTRAPVERLPVEADDWEPAVAELVSRVIDPLGLELVALTRAPYISGGDPGRPLYVLDDAVLVCRARPSPGVAAASPLL